VSERPLVRVLATARPLGGRLALSLLLAACAVGAGVALMGTSGYLISRAALRPPILSLAVTIVAVRFFGISRGVLRYGERLVSHDAALRLLGRVRVMFFERLEPQVPDGLPAGSRSAELLGRFVSDVDDLQHLFVRALGPPIVALLVGAGTALAALLIDPASGVVLALALTVAGVGIPLLAARVVRATGRREAQARAELLGDVVDVLGAAPELTVAGRVPDALVRVAERERELGRIRRRSALAGGLGEGLVTLLAGLTLVAVVLVAAPAVHDGTLRGIWLGTLALLALASFEAIRPLPVAAEQLGATEAAAGRLYDVIDRPPPVTDPPGPAPVPRGLELRADGVTVWHGGRTVLDAVDLSLRPGEAVALVGPSGVGKTTLAHCLVRFRDPDAGRVLLDGHDLREIRQDDVRAVVLLVDQDAHLFATTIRENLRLARPGAGDDELREALAAARILDWVDALPDGLDTQVGEQGRLLSGGQRQRIALARAFVARAPLVVFDEPTAHLDADAAVGIVDTILELRDNGRGVLLITHSSYGLERFDEVVRLDS
jgi:ATP-binding cassette, subfamily C, bacterial CydC